MLKEDVRPRIDPGRTQRRGVFIYFAPITPRKERLAGVDWRAEASVLVGQQQRRHAAIRFGDDPEPLGVVQKVARQNATAGFD